MRALNLYAGIGGNRACWPSDVDVTAVEFDPEIANVYAGRFPQDDVRIDDAVGFLEKHFASFDFIWASPPCQSHGQLRHNVGVLAQGKAPVVPDMTSLYGVIVFLKTYFKGKWVVENTRPYYEPLIAPTAKVGRHFIWSNFALPPITAKAPNNVRGHNRIDDFAEAGLVRGTSIANKRQVLRNCVDADLGLALLEAARKDIV